MRAQAGHASQPAGQPRPASLRRYHPSPSVAPTSQLPGLVAQHAVQPPAPLLRLALFRISEEAQGGRFDRYRLHFRRLQMHVPSALAGATTNRTSLGPRSLVGHDATGGIFRTSKHVRLHLQTLCAKQTVGPEASLTCWTPPRCGARRCCPPSSRSCAPSAGRPSSCRQAGRQAAGGWSAGCSRQTGSAAVRRRAGQTRGQRCTCAGHRALRRKAGGNGNACAGTPTVGNRLPCLRLLALPWHSNPPEQLCVVLRDLQHCKLLQRAPPLVRHVVQHQQGAGVQQLAVVPVVRLQGSQTMKSSIDNCN